jgi:hypothetical protein
MCNTSNQNCTKQPGSRSMLSLQLPEDQWLNTARHSGSEVCPQCACSGTPPAACCSRCCAPKQPLQIHAFPCCRLRMELDLEAAGPLHELQAVVLQVLLDDRADAGLAILRVQPAPCNDLHHGCAARQQPVKTPHDTAVSHQIVEVLQQADAVATLPQPRRECTGSRLLAARLAVCLAGAAGQGRLTLVSILDVGAEQVDQHVVRLLHLLAMQVDPLDRRVQVQVPGKEQQLLSARLQ